MQFLAIFAGRGETSQFWAHELLFSAAAVDEEISFSTFARPGTPLSLSEILEAEAAAVTTKSACTPHTGASMLHPALLVNLSSLEAAGRVAGRCVLLRGLYRCWVVASTISGAIDGAIRKSTTGGDGSADFARCLSAPSFKYTIDAVGRKVSQTERQAAFDRLREIPHTGVVQMKDPAVEFLIMAFRNPKSSEEQVYYCSYPQLSARLSVLGKYDLKQRPYIGTTSMPPELTMLMANYAKVKRNDVVCDPFCGTGSILVTATHLGATTLGSDMDGRVMQRGTIRDIRTKAVQKRVRESGSYAEARTACSSVEEEGPSMWTNFAEYELTPSPERVRLNFSLWAKVWRAKSGLWDAIMTDPPYGVREQKKKVDVSNLHESETKIAGGAAEDYGTDEMLLDLVHFSAQLLVIGGRLVFWHPTGVDYTDSEIPSHPAMKLLASIEQPMTLKSSRYLVVMERVPYDGVIEREACRPLKAAANLRQLMSNGDEGGDNEAVEARRARVEKQREATRAYKESHGIEPKSKVTKAERRARTMENRVKNEVHRAWHKVNTDLTNMAAGERAGTGCRLSTEQRQCLWALKEVMPKSFELPRQL